MESERGRDGERERERGWLGAMGCDKQKWRTGKLRAGIVVMVGRGKRSQPNGTTGRGKRAWTVGMGAGKWRWRNKKITAREADSR